MPHDKSWQTESESESSHSSESSNSDSDSSNGSICSSSSNSHYKGKKKLKGKLPKGPLMSASDPSDDSYLHKNAVDSYSSEISYPAPDKKLISLGDSL